MSIAEELDKDLRAYSEQIKSDCDRIAKEVQAKMLAEIPSRTPVGDYGTHDNKKNRINESVGHLRDGWAKGDIVLRNSGGKLYGVRSKNKPQLVHLVNFPHKIVAMAYGDNSRGTATFRHVATDLYRTDTGKMTKGDPFVDEVQDEGAEELERRLSEYFGGSG